MERKALKQLFDWKTTTNRKPLILRGARQVGKTFLLKEFGKEGFPRCHYVNFEKEPAAIRIFEKDLDPQRIVRELEIHLSHPIYIGEDFLVLDEIGYAPKALTSLKYFAEDMPELALCAAGSLLGLQLGESSFPVGKVGFLEIHPMSFPEFLRGTGEAPAADLLEDWTPARPLPEIMQQRLWDSLKNYLVVGGLPEVVEIFAGRRERPGEALALVRKRQEELAVSYVADMAKHAGKINAMHVERVWRHVPSVLGSEQDGGAPKFRFKGIFPGARRFSQLAGPIDWLVTAGLVTKVPVITGVRMPLSSQVRENRFKLYGFDIGMLGAVAGTALESILAYDFGTYKGYLAENLVLQELLAAGQRIPYCWQEGAAEVEFLLENRGLVVPLEVKSGWTTQAKSLRVFDQKYHPPLRIILSARPPLFDFAHRICHLPLYLAGKLEAVLADRTG